MSISKDELIKRQEELQTNFDTMKDRIKSMDIELGNLKANLNATAGALQMVNQLLADIDSKAESKEPMPAEKMEALNIATS
jgi:predicted nuclease with TOPRIM domain